MANYRERLTKIVVYDPIDNKPYTEFDLEQCDSRTELRLRRLMEGRIGSSTYDTYMEIQDIKQQQAVELARKLAE
jgi:cysteine synthase